MSNEYLIAKRSDYETAHILHLLLTVFTGGLWLIVWFLIAIKNALKRRKIDKKLEQFAFHQTGEKG